jgi:exopolyphosphatase/guanosine-5'-triphosphate,3'-diphosphate pyrophosphatase
MKAVVDIGSNSVKFLIADTRQNTAPHYLESGSWVTRLGKNLEQSKRLDPESLQATKNAFLEMRRVFDDCRAQQAQALELCVVATSAVRDCHNPEDVARLVRDIFAAPLKIIEGQVEARFSIEGAAAAAEQIYGERDALFVDVGGASTELGFLRPSFRAQSFQAGAVRCHERLGLTQMPVSNETWEKARARIAEFFPQPDFEALKSFRREIPRHAVAVGGSLVLAARLMNAVESGNGAGFVCQAKSFEALNERIRRLSLDERLALPHMQAGRADVLCAGILCLLYPLKQFGIDEFAVTPWGLRHGILRKWDEFNRSPGVLTLA